MSKIKIRNCFETPKKAAVSVACIAAVLFILGTGTVFAVTAIAENSAIGAENAKNFAFADAGVDPVTTKHSKAEFEFEQGHFVYEVTFFAGDAEYEYLIKAADGSVIKKEIEIRSADGGNTAVTAQITMEEAKEIALADAGVKAEDAVFSKEKLDLDDGMSVYEIDFAANDVKYEYEIDANSGDVYSKSKETFSAGAVSVPDQTAPGNTGGTISAEEAKAKALADAGVSASDAVCTKTKLDNDDGISVYDIEFYTSSYEYEYEIDAATGAVVSRDSEARKVSAGSGQAGNQGNNKENSQASGQGTSSESVSIDINKAKAIAAAQAGLSVSDIVFSKVELDDDDGIMVYEVEFDYGSAEYEYKIHALTGDILDYDIDYDD